MKATVENKSDVDKDRLDFSFWADHPNINPELCLVVNSTRKKCNIARASDLNLVYWIPLRIYSSYIASPALSIKILIKDYISQIDSQDKRERSTAFFSPAREWCMLNFEKAKKNTSGNCGWNISLRYLICLSNIMFECWFADFLRQNNGDQQELSESFPSLNLRWHSKMSPRPIPRNVS